SSPCLLLDAQHHFGFFGLVLVPVGRVGLPASRRLAISISFFASSGLPTMAASFSKSASTMPSTSRMPPLISSLRVASSISSLSSDVRTGGGGGGGGGAGDGPKITVPPVATDFGTTRTGTTSVICSAAPAAKRNAVLSRSTSLPLRSVTLANRSPSLF